MNLSTGIINKKVSLFFTNKNNIDSPPILWVSFFKKDSKYRILGSMLVLDSFLPEEIRNGNKDLNKCLSFMYHIYKEKGSKDMNITIPGNIFIHNKRKYKEYLFNDQQKSKEKGKKK